MFIWVSDIAIRVGEKILFDHTNWNIETGQSWAMIGPTGSGKTILAKAISREAALLHGQIRYYFDGPEPAQSRSFVKANEILTFSAETHRAFLRQFSEYHQARWQSMEGQNAPTVADLLSPHRISPAWRVTSELASEESPEPKKAEVIALFGLEPLLGRKVHQLSHGESRKVFLARLLMRSPKLLILEDLFDGLDLSSRERLSAATERLIAVQSPPVLFVGSRLEDIPRGITHLMLVKDKHVLAQGAREGITADKALLESLQDQPVLPSSGAFSAMLGQYTLALNQNLRSADPVMIDLRDVSITYRDTRVLKNITWTVRQGERWSLRGENGAGKSTLLSLILADNPQAYANDIYVFGKKRGSGESIWDIKKKIGAVSPELQIYYEKTASCMDVICSGFFDSVGLYRQPLQDQIDIATSWVRALGIESLIGRPYHTLSTGQQRLILLARALVKNPLLLILDEPCQGLDDFYRRWFIGLIEQLCQQAPVTLIYVTHYQDEIPAAMTHQLQLRQGEIRQIGPIA